MINLKWLSRIFFIAFIHIFLSCQTNPLKSEIGKMTSQQAKLRFGSPDETNQLPSGFLELSWFISSEFGSLRKQVMTFNDKGLLADVRSYYVGEVTPPLGPVFTDKYERSVLE